MVEHNSALDPPLGGAGQAFLEENAKKTCLSGTTLKGQYDRTEGNNRGPKNISIPLDVSISCFQRPRSVMSFEMEPADGMCEGYR